MGGILSNAVDISSSKLVLNGDVDRTWRSTEFSHTSCWPAFRVSQPICHIPEGVLTQE